ncbi:hypothetical protein L596_011747 [Steinernema carpocapsae]|uniref:Peptidase M16 middle/third domain-containing protein n=1 Tax=Steinernema carpocapsae TaxID=34508 RepID=A0A4U5NVT9_STECR|nr:hypothetical protein L596_011747 [Steinernema carpocapsae]
MENLQSFPANNGASANLTEIVARFHDITKPLSDVAEYRGLELANGIRILLISDPYVDKSKACMSVNVGDLMDPVELPGLAKLCQKMIFLACKKYPKENGFGKVVAKHGGRTQWYLEHDTTDFSFEVPSKYFKSVLERWIQFFVSPLFADNTVRKVINGLDTEFQTCCKNDISRINQIRHVMSTPGHDWSKVRPGNKLTLMDIPAENGIDVEKELKKFYEKHYSANLMTCLIVDKRPLDKLEKLVQKSDFGKVVNKNLERKMWEEKPYGPGQLGHRIDVVPIQNTKSLKIMIPVDDLCKYYKSNPFHYVCHLIFNKHEGGLSAELQKRDWAYSVHGWIGPSARGIAFLSAIISLTDEGLQHVENILELFFHLISSIKATGVQEWRHDELAKIKKINFCYSEQRNHSHFLPRLEKRLHRFPFKDILSEGQLMENFNPELIQQLLNQLTPQNMNYFVIHKGAKNLRSLVTEEHLGAEYKKMKIDEEWMEKFQKALLTPHEVFHLPQKNEFFPIHFDLKPKDENFSDVPKVIHCDDHSRIWFMQNVENMPKATVFILLKNPKTHTDNMGRLMINILKHCFIHQNSFEECHHEYLRTWSNIQIVDEGTEIYFTGFDDNLATFIKNKIRRLRSYKADEKSFNLVLKKLTKTLKDESNRHSLTWESITQILGERTWSVSGLQAVSEHVTFDMFNAFISQLWDAFHVEILAYGNLTQTEVLDLTQEVTGIFKGSESVRPLCPSEVRGIRQLKIKEGDSCVYETDRNSRENSNVNIKLQIGPIETRIHCLLNLFHRIVMQPIENVLRKKERLGVVLSQTSVETGTLSFNIKINGGFDVKYVNERFEAFLKDVRIIIASMTDEEFSNHIKSLTVGLHGSKHKHSTIAAGNVWNEIRHGHFMFKRGEILAEELKNINKEDVLNFYDQKISAESKQRQKLSVLTRSTLKKGKIPENHVLEERKEIQILDIEQFKSTLEAYPLPQPAIDVPGIGQKTAAWQ